MSKTVNDIQSKPVLNIDLPTCRKCLYSRETPTRDKLICKFNPPTTVPIIHQLPENKTKIRLYTNYAIVNASDTGCGQYKKR